MLEPKFFILQEKRSWESDFLKKIQRAVSCYCMIVRISFLTCSVTLSVFSEKFGLAAWVNIRQKL